MLPWPKPNFRPPAPRPPGANTEGHEGYYASSRGDWPSSGLPTVIRDHDKESFQARKDSSCQIVAQQNAEATTGLASNAKFYATNTTICTISSSKT